MRKVFLFLFFLLAFVGLLLILLLIQREKGDLNQPDTFSPLPLGWKALYTTLEKSGFSVHRWQSPYDTLPSVNSVMILTAPTEYLSHSELLLLRPWIHQGGVFLFFSGLSASFLSPAIESAIYDTFQVETPFLATDSRVGVQVEDVFPGEAMRSYSKKLKLRVYRPASLTTHLQDASPVLRRMDRSPVAYEIPMGSGKVYFFSSYDYLTNEWILSQDNFQFFYEWLKNLDRPIYFDEYHHGYVLPRVNSVPGVSALHPFFPIQLIFLLLVYLWVRGVRFGSIRFLPEQEKLRGALDFVNATGHLYQKAQLRSEIFSLLYRDFRHFLFHRYGVSPSLPDLANLRNDPLWKKIQPVEYLRQQLEVKPSLEESDLFKFSARLEQVKEELRAR